MNPFAPPTHYDQQLSGLGCLAPPPSSVAMGVHTPIYPTNRGMSPGIYPPTSVSQPQAAQTYLYGKCTKLWIHNIFTLMGLIILALQFVCWTTPWAMAPQGSK